MSSSRRVAAWGLNVIDSPLGPCASSALEFRRHEQKREGLRAALGARDGLPRLVRSEWRERLFEHIPRIGVSAEAAGKLIGDVEALRQPIEPGGAFVGEALGRRRPP